MKRCKWRNCITILHKDKESKYCYVHLTRGITQEAEDKEKEYQDYKHSYARKRWKERYAKKNKKDIKEYAQEWFQKNKERLNEKRRQKKDINGMPEPGKTPETKGNVEVVPGDQY